MNAVHAETGVDPISPFEAQEFIAKAIEPYRTPIEMQQAHANCLGVLPYVTDPDTQVFLQSCVIALRHRLSFGIPFGPSILPASRPRVSNPALECQPQAGGPDSSGR